MTHPVESVFTSSHKNALRRTGCLRKQPLLTVRTLIPLGWLMSLTALVSGCATAPSVSSQVVEPVPPSLPPVPPVILSEEEVSNYATTVLAIETVRQESFTEMQQAVSPGTLPPNFVCNQPDTVADLPKKAQTIAVDYCTQAKQISESNGLSLTRFNEITANLATDTTLQQEIQEELIRQQRSGFTR